MKGLLTPSQYAKIEFTHKMPYVLLLEKARKKMLYVGTKHTFNPQNKHLSDFKNLVYQFKPECILLEGSTRNENYKNKKESVLKAGEMGYIKYLADSINIKTLSIEVSFERQLNELAKFYSLKEIFVFVLTRTAPFGFEFIQKDLADLQKMKLFNSFDCTLENYKKTYLEIVNERFDLGNKMRMINLTTPTKKESVLNSISVKINAIRDCHIILKIDKILNTYSKSISFIGASHVVIQEPVLRSKYKIQVF